MVSFKENPEAFCRWAKSHTSRHEALAVFAGPADAWWSEAPALYVAHLAWPPFWEGETVNAARAIRAKLIEQVVSGPMSDAAHASLPGLFNTAVLSPLEEATRIIAWIVEQADPNDATMIADILGHVIWSKDEEFVRICFPLVEWLLKKGSSELRSGRRSQMVAHLLPLVVRIGPDELLAPAIRYILYNEHRVGADGWGQRTVEELLPAIERLLLRAHAEAIIGDMIEACAPPALASYVDHVLRRWAEFPRSRAEVVRRFARGEFALPNPLMTWGQIVDGRVVDVVTLDANVVREAAEGLVHSMLGTPKHVAGKGAWGQIVARELLRTTDVLATRAHDDIRRLQQCAGFDPGVAEGVYGALRDAVEGSDDPALAPARSILAAPHTGTGVVSAALELMKSAPPPRRPSPKRGPVEHVVEAVQRALLTDVPPVAGFDFKKVAQGATGVRLADLPDQRAFQVEDGVLGISRSAVDGLVALSGDPDVQRALGVLYAVHEVVHDFQGIAGKDQVSTVRFAGAESALMHIDLGADHVAAVIATAIFPEWELLWLKDLQGKSIRGFAATARNPPYSRIRKTLRLVGLRTDLALRKLGLAREHLAKESYGFADFSPSGGAFIAMANRPPFVVVKTGKISSADASTLFEGIEGGDGAIERVDQVIASALAR